MKWLKPQKELVDEGFNVMPHFPARIIKDQNTCLKTGLIDIRGEAGIKQALLLAGGVHQSTW